MTAIEAWRAGKLTVDEAWQALYISANDEKRQASKNHWLRCYVEAMRDGVPALIQQAEHKLAQMALLDAVIVGPATIKRH